jgi:sporulation integral membrane protein YlbJ
MKQKYSIFISLFIIIFIFLLFKNTNIVLSSVIKGMDIWKNNIFPSLFPFLIISHIMIEYGFIELFKEIFKPIMHLFKINSNASFILAMSILSGSPSNAKYTKELYLKGLISKGEAEKVLTFTYFSSPLFILGTLSLTYLNNFKVGMIILISHYLSNFIIAFLFRNYCESSDKNYKINLNNAFNNMLKIQRSKNISNIIVKSIKESLDVTLLILGSVTFIFIVTAALNDIMPNNVYLNATIKGFLEMTQGLQAISVLNIDIFHKGLLSVMVLSFGGISIYIQIISILSDTDLSTYPFLFSRILHAFISSILFLLFYNIWIIF